MINKLIEFAPTIDSSCCSLSAWRSLPACTRSRTSTDAVPDLSDTQVIIYTRWDRSPDIIEDQVTYPIISNMLGVPRVKDIRGFSDFGLRLHHF